MSRRPIQLLGSIAIKLGAVLLAMAGTTAVAMAIGLTVIAALTGSISSLLDTRLPAIETSAGVMDESAATAEALGDLERALTAEALAARKAALTVAHTRLEDTIGRLDPSVASRLDPLLEGFRGAAERVAVALDDEFAALATLAAGITELQALREEAHDTLEDRLNLAYADLTAGGTATIDEVNTTLSALTEREFGMVRAILDARAELNLAVGAALLLIETPDPGFVATLRDLAAGSLQRFDAAMAVLEENSRLYPKLATVVEARDTLWTLVSGDLPERGAQQRLLDLRDRSDADLGVVIDDMSFALVLLSDETAARNASVIGGLLETQVGRIRRAADLDSAVNTVLVEVLGTASQNDADALENAKARLGHATERLAGLATTAELEAALATQIARILEIADPGTGLATTRSTVLSARERTLRRADEARAALSEIVVAARAEGAAAVAAMAQAGATLLAEADAAERRMQLVGASTLGLFLLAPVLTWLLILRPMGRVTRITERLATGDLAPVTGFARTGGEIGRMAAALSVFRDGLIEREEMRRLEAQREEEQRQAERRAVEDQRRREAETEAAEAAARAEAQRREAAEEARLAELRRVAEAERDARAAELDVVVKSLGAALDALSAGDLTVTIPTAFAQSYEGLRTNLNGAIVSLSDVISRLSESATSVSGSSGEIAKAANELAQRTEQNAAALEETFAAITELNASARSTAERAREAEEVMSRARREAQASKKTVESAVSTMAEIEASSNAIAEIVDLIESIAFQTNLLALNAGVEAARAGDQGRGFGVVAMEVRSLAQRSSDAAREINTLITATLDRISAGANHVGQAGSALNGIIELITGTSEKIATIAEAAREQSASVSEISTTIGQVDEATQKNALLFEKSLAASEFLKSESEALLQIALRFRTERGSATSAVRRVA